MKRLLSFLVLLAFFMPGDMAAQNSDLGNWLIYFGNKKIDSRWNWHHEVQYRNYDAIGDLEQLLLRTGIGYRPEGTDLNLLLGYGYILSENYIGDSDDKVSIGEHRIYQQFITRQNGNRLKLQHRLRLEERWIDDADFRMRFRYFLSANIGLNGRDIIPGTWYASIYNEIFLNLGDNVFDRNRLYGGIGYKLNSLARFEIGYMNQFFKNGSRDQLNLITFLSF